MKKSLPLIFSVALVAIVLLALFLIRSGGQKAPDQASSSNPEQNVAQDPATGEVAGEQSGSEQSADAKSGKSHHESTSADSAQSNAHGSDVQGGVVAGGAGASGTAASVGSQTGTAGTLKAGEQATTTQAGAAGAAGVGVVNGAAAGAAGVVAGAAPAVPAVETHKTPTAPGVPACVRVAFQPVDKEIKVKRHELALTSKVESKKDLCVTVNGEGVSFNLEGGNKIVLDRRIREKSTEIVATYCLSGACELSCPKAKKDFFDAISSESSDEVIRGFAGDQSAEEKQLQRELSSLQKLLQEPNAKKKVAQWTESKRNEGPCSQVVQYTKF